MTRLTPEEQAAFQSLDRNALQQPDLADDLRMVLQNPVARLEYIRFATEASRFFRGRQEIGFRGDNWLL